MTRTFVTPRRWSALLLATAFGLVQACSSKDNTGPAKAITVTLNPTSASVQQGGSTNVTVTVTGTGGFTAVPAINVTGLPTGTTVAVSNIQTSGSTTTATVTLTVGATTATGVYPITATATATGVTTVTATFTLTVTAAPTPSFTLSLTPTTLSVAQGASGTSTVNIARTNLTGAIALAVTGAPTGVTATLNPTSATGTASTLTVAAASNATVGAATLTITGTATGAANQTVTLPITITASTAGVTLTSTPAAVSVAQGATGNATINVARTNFTGDLTFAATNLPTGVTAAFVPNPNTGTGTASTLTFTVGATAVPGTTNVTVTGTGTGITAATTTVALTVTAATSGVTLTLTPATLSVAQGASAVTTVNIARTNFTGNPTLTAEGLPAGVTAAFVPNPPTGTASSLTLTASATATVGTSTVTIRGTGTGIADATIPLALTVTATGGGNYTLAAAPAAVSVTVGGAAGTSTINITRTGGFAGSVALAVTGAPNGVTATLTPTSTTGNTSALSITAAAGATLGNATLTITGTATGLANQTTAVALTVAAAGGGNYTLAAAPAAVSVTQGGAAATSTININRTGGLTADVALAVTGAPTGVTATLNPTTSSGTGATSTLTITAAAGATIGASTLTITGTSAGLTNQTTAVALTVAASGGGGNVTVDFSACLAANKPIWLASQNGTSGWTQVTNVGDVYRFNVTQGKGGLAYATQSASGGTAVVVQYLTQAELTAAATLTFCATTGGKTITGTVAGLATGDGATISLGSAIASPFANGAVTLNGVLTGNQDLVAYRSNFLAPGTTDKAIIRRDQNIAAGGTFGTVDFGAAEAFNPATGTATITNAGSDMISASVLYYTTAACVANSLGTNAFASASFTMRGIPAAQQRATDFHSMTISAFTASATSFRTIITSFKVLADKSFALGVVLPTPTVTSLAGAGYKRLQAALTLPADYQSGLTLSYTGGTRTASLTATFGWLGGAAATLAFPDFTGVGGWQDVWAPATGTTANWVVAAFGSTITSTAGFCVEGATLKQAAVTGSL